MRAGNAKSLARMRPARVTRLRWNPLLISGLVLFGIIVLIGIVAPFFLTGPATAITSQMRLGVSWHHLFGTDDFGRDMLARTLVATRLTLIMAFIATAAGVAVGVLLGALIWVAPRRLREVSLRVLETLVAYPGLLITIVIVSILGAGSSAIVIGIAFAGIHGYARMTANLVAGIVNRDYVTAARLLGVSRFRLIVRHLLPNIAEAMLIIVSGGFGGAVLDLSGLSFIGLGVQSPQYDFGKLLNDALPAIYTQPSQVLAPAIMIVLTILGAMLIGDGLAAAAHPRTSRRGKGVDWSDVADRPRIPRQASRNGSAPFVEVRELRVRTDNGSELLHAISFDIAEGEILGVVGESGSGKSITAMSLAALLPEGVHSRATTLRIGDDDLTGTFDAQALARRLALIYQDPATTFSPALRLGSQLMDVPRTHLGLGRRAARAQVIRALTDVRMSKPSLRLKQFPYELSGGMQQRAMIAAALSADPRLIIADEPTTGLDVIVQAEILDRLREINTQRGTTILFISHDIGVVAELCHRVLVMKEGEIVETLTAADMLAGHFRHPYTRMLVAATPRIEEAGV